MCAGLLAWIIEKMWRWVDGELEACISKDELLTNISLFWFTQSITSSMRLYREAIGPQSTAMPDILKHRCKVGHPFRNALQMGFAQYSWGASRHAVQKGLLTCLALIEQPSRQSQCSKLPEAIVVSCQPPCLTLSRTTARQAPKIARHSHVALQSTVSMSMLALAWLQGSLPGVSTSARDPTRLSSVQCLPCLGAYEQVSGH